MRRRWYGRFVDRSAARRLAEALRSELWFSASNDLLARLGDRGGVNVGLNPSEEFQDEELVEVVWRALQAVGLAEDDSE